MESRPQVVRPLDGKDRRILQALLENARASLSAIGRRIGLSQPAVSERVRRLEERGVIAGYAARVDPQALGLGLEAFLRVRARDGQAAACLALCERLPHVLDAWKVTGDASLLLRCAFERPAQLEELCDRLAAQAEVASSVVLAHPVKRLPRMDGTVVPLRRAAAQGHQAAGDPCQLQQRAARPAAR